MENRCPKCGGLILSASDVTDRRYGFIMTLKCMKCLREKSFYVERQDIQEAYEERLEQFKRILIQEIHVERDKNDPMNLYVQSLG